MKKRTLIIIGVLAVLVVAGVLFAPRILGASAANQQQFQTVTAERGQLTASIGASGTVLARQSAVLNWQTSGQVEAIGVVKGDRVETDEVLAQLEPSSLPQSLITAQADLLNAQRGLETVLDNSEARANAHLAMIQAQEAYDDALKDTQSKLYQRAGQNTIDIARANLILAEQALDDAEEAYNLVRTHNANDETYAAALSRLASARQQRDRSEFNLRYVQELPDPLEVEKASALLDQAEARLLTAKQEWERVKDGPDPADVSAARARVAAAQASVDLASIAAPFAGTITEVANLPGDLINPGMNAFRLDDLDHLQIEAQVSEVDINRVAVGNPVTVTFDAILNTVYSAVVTDVAAVGATVNGVVNFSVTAEIIDTDGRILPGMTAGIEIIVEQLGDVLLIPNRAVRMVNNERVVYRLENGIPTPVPVTLGSTDNTFSQLLAGEIQPGDAIVLNPPTSSFFGPGGGGPGGGFQSAP